MIALIIIISIGIVLEFILMFIEHRNRKPDEPTLDEQLEELRDSCSCKLPEETCPYCRKLVELEHTSDGIPFRADQPKSIKSIPKVIIDRTENKYKFGRRK